MNRKQIIFTTAAAIFILVSSVAVTASAAPASPERMDSHTPDPLRKTAIESDQNPPVQNSFLTELKTGQNVTITREGQIVIIRVNESVFEDQNETEDQSSRTVSVTVQGVEGSVDLALKKQPNGLYKNRITIKNLVNESAWERDLSSATVMVVFDNQKIGKNTTDLRWITLADEGRIQGQNLIVPAQSIIGIPHGTRLGFQIENARIQGTINNLGNSPNVSVDLGEAPRNSLLSSSITIRPVRTNLTDSPSTIDLSSLVAKATRLRYSGESLALENPLFTLLPSTERYIVRVYKPEGKVIYATVNSTQGGKFSLPQPFVNTDIDVAIWTVDENHQILSRDAQGQPYSVSKPSVNASLVGRNLTVSNGKWSITTLLYRNETGDVHVLDVTRSNGIYRLENASVLSTNGSVFLIADSGQILDANINISQPPNGSGERKNSGLEGSGGGIPYVNNFVAFTIVAVAPIIPALLLYLLSGDFSDNETVTFVPFLIVLIIGGAVSIVVNEYSPFGRPLSIIQSEYFELIVVASIGCFSAFLSIMLFEKWATEGNSSSQKTETTPMKQLTVLVRDKQGNPLSSEVQITAKPIHGSGVPKRGEPHHATVKDGRTSLTLPHENFRISARIGDQKWSRDVNVSRNPSGETISFVLEKPRITVKVIDKQSRKALPNATVTVRADGESGEETTDSKGETVFTLPFSTNQVVVEADADRYGSERKLTPVSGSVTKIPLEPKTGNIRARVTIDGQPTANIPTAVMPGEDSRRNEDQVEGKTKFQGEFTARDLLVGEYKVAIHVDDKRIKDRTTRVRVKEDDTTMVTLDSQFDWDLSSRQWRRIKYLKDEVASLSDRPNRDVAIPRYFGSVLEEVLSAVESLEDAGHLFVPADLEPDELADGTLDAVEAALERVEQAMSAKTNVDLFVACSDMTDPEIRWDGEVSITALFDRPTRNDYRQTLAEQVDSVKHSIEQERTDIAEIAPVQTMFEEITQLVRQSQGMDPITQKLTMYVAEVMLDAIEQIFEYTPLKERMKNTVF